ncbi:hypothetical protein K491DRAFT_680761 [Lophiostoma macrostomum CBS 122681]|uniref:Uncharacterized protein n=1 Tax=Lophiostoma macrostomum CBS 122681 TaxID=1314788 RepID=A0A6A6T206_9PLEO|nr:hypothetical protein K491DRAFT_680761 [Lophiostoma macrostomum CBS 122681]
MGKVAKSGPWSSGRFINCNYTLSKIVIDTLTRTFSLNRVTIYSAGHVRKNYHSMQLFCPTAAFGLMSLLVYNVHGSRQSPIIGSVGIKRSFNNPPDLVKDWVALGDSYSAGPGAGNEYDPGGGSGKCMRRHLAYAPILQADENMLGPNGPRNQKPTFTFAACTGDTTKDLLDFSDPNANQLQKIRSGETTFATLSIGGNDILFADILAVCVYGKTLKNVGRTCGKELEKAGAILFGRDFHGRYMQMLDYVITEKFKWQEPNEASVLYQTGYIQFFDDFTTYCDSHDFLGLNPQAPKMTQDRRRTLNLIVHQLNEVLQYWIDLHNNPRTKYINRDGQMRRYVTPIHFVNIDWRYNDHRFCREGVKEPDRKTEDTWFFHAPKVPVPKAQQNNETWINETVELWPLTWEPGRPGQPGLDLNANPDEELPPFDPNNITHLLAKESIVRTFHPKPAGFDAEKEGLIYEIYKNEKQRDLTGRSLTILCIGDFSALGEGYENITPDRYGFIPYLHAMLNHDANFGGSPILHRFVGSQKTGYAGDVGHEIYPNGRYWKQIARYAASTAEFQSPLGKVILIMMGAKDIQLGRPVSDILPEVHWLLSEIWHYDESATVLLASVPMMGDIQDNGSEFWPTQKVIIELNAQFASIVNYYNRYGKKIIYVRLSATQQLRVRTNPYVPNAEGYHRIAFDFLNGIVLANKRGFFDGDAWGNSAGFSETPGYELTPFKDNEITGGIKCHQKKKSNHAPTFDTITKSLFRGAKDQDGWINSYACNKTFVFKFSWDAENYNSSAALPFSGGKTCSTFGGDNETHSTIHQFLVRRENIDDNLDDWCKTNLNTEVHMEDTGGTENVQFICPTWYDFALYVNPPKPRAYLWWLYEDYDTTDTPSIQAVPNWRGNYHSFDEAMSGIKSGIAPAFTSAPGDTPDNVPDQELGTTSTPAAYSTFDPGPTNAA